MLQYKRNLILDVYDYSGNKQCTLYDSTSDLAGQAADVVVTTERNGWKELSFTIPSTCENADGAQEPNFRQQYLKADYRVRLKDDNGVDWYLLSEPKITHQAFSQNVTVKAGHIAQLLKTKNLGLEFSDEEGNNVGTAEELLTTILDGTGWSVGSVAEFREKRSGEIKKRSMKASAKTGAFKLISSMCDLFEAKPIYHGEGRIVDIVPMNPFSEPEDGSLPDVSNGKTIELHYGKNVKNVTRTLNTENLVTKLYIYGAFGDKTSGYCGIDEWTHPEITLRASAKASSGQECCFTVTDNVAGINYVRYFTPTNQINKNKTVIWSMLDPASMSYVWNAATNKAYPVYTEPKTANPIVFNVYQTDIVTNQFSYLMDFDYYRSVDLLTDNMIQTIAEYQRNMPARLEAINTASAAFAESLGELSDTIGTVDFCRLDAVSYDNNAGYVRINLNTTDYTKGVMYRTDYTVREKKQFKWRVAEQLRANGDPTNSGSSIVYILHDTDPITFDIGYLKAIDDEDDPTQLTIWVEYSGFSGNSSTDHIYLFAANTINGYLGSVQVMDEAAVMSQESTTKVVTTRHDVYFSKTTPVQASEVLEYAWWWKYDDVNPSEMYFCYQSNGDTSWNRVYFTDFNPSEGYAAAVNSYCYNWRGATLWKKTGTGSTDWLKLGDLYDTAEVRLVSKFGSVWASCRTRDRLWKGFYQYVTVNITQAIIEQFRDSNSGTTLPIGNYAIADEYGNYHTFTTKTELGTNDKFVYDSTNGWIVITDSTDDPDEWTTASVIDKTVETKEYRFDNVNENPGNVAADAAWTEGDLEIGTGAYARDSVTIKEGGGEIANSGTTYYRSGFLGVYPNIAYNLSGLSDCYVLFYTLEHGYLGYAHVTNGGDYAFRTSPNTRFIRVKSTVSDPDLIINARNYASTFVADEEQYCILSTGTGSGVLKGILPLTEAFRDLSDQAYLVDYQAVLDAQNRQKQQEMTLVTTLGDMYREGYWQKSDYVDGDEEKLYYDGLENLEHIAKPECSYNIQYLDLYGANHDNHLYSANEIAAGVYWPDIEADYAVHLVDPDIGVSQWAFIDKIQKCYDQPWKTGISINTNLSTISQHSFTDVMTHIAEVASKVNGKMEVYDRSEMISDTGTVAASALQGVIDANTLLITGGSSTWYTDNNGNLMFVSADNKSAMALTGNGFAIANSKDEYGEWQWRTFGTGEGFVADLIVAGTIKADLIAAQSITANKLASDVGSSLDMSSNQSIRLIVSDETQLAMTPQQEQIDRNQAATTAAINQTKSEISVYIRSSQFLEDNETQNQRLTNLSLTDASIQAEVGDISRIVGTSIQQDDNGLHLKQYQTDNWEALLTSTALSFQTSGAVAASFGADGAYADRLRSNKTLSVGTEEDGWFDFTTTSSGLAEKWRDGTNGASPLFFVSQPTNYYAVYQTGTHAVTGSSSWPETFVFTAEISGADASTTYSLQYRRYAGDSWHDSGLTAAVSGETVSFTGRYSPSGTGTCDYRIAITKGTTVIYSDVVKYLLADGPVIYTNLPETVVCDSSYNAIALTALATGSVASYQWQTLNVSNSTWSDISGATQATYSTTVSGDMVVRCVIVDTNGKPTPSASVAITYES